jgi:4-diphosphocytidyl-2-C-methyl-D-erythritol kinase
MKMTCSLLKFALFICLHFVTKSHAFGIIIARPATTRVSPASLNSANSDSDSDSDSDSLTLFSPCKINLFLRIIRKREDGYHDLASLFQSVGFGDTLELSVLQHSAVDEFECNMPGVPIDQSNLVLRALTLMREKTLVNTYFKANLIKSVPAQAGLGGGSANAATAMYGANELMGRPATLEQVRNYTV